MIPDCDATNHLVFKVEYCPFSDLFPNQPELDQLQNEINLMAQSGWQLDKIIPWTTWGRTQGVLIVFSGLADSHRSQEAEG